MSYEELILGNWTSDDKNCTASVQEYIDLLKLEFIPTVPNKFDAHNLSLVNVELAVQNKLNTADVSILEEMFMKLAYELGQLEPVLIPAIQKEPLRVESKFLTDTGNNGGFLVEVCYIVSEFPFPEKSTSTFSAQKKLGDLSSKIQAQVAQSIATMFSQVKATDPVVPNSETKVQANTATTQVFH